MLDKKSKKLIEGVGIYAIGTFGTKILSFLIVPLYTYYISTGEMGIYDVLLSTISLLSPIITMQISKAAYCWITQNDENDNKQYIIATMQVLIVNTAVAVAIILLVSRFITIPYCLYFCVLLFLSRSFETMKTLLRGLNRTITYSAIGIVYTIVFLALNVIQLIVLKKGVESLFSSAIIANLLSILIIVFSVPEFRINYFVKPDLKLIAKMYKFSIPLVPNDLNWWIINSSDRYITLMVLGSSYNGILAIAHKFPTLLQTVLNLFNYSWQDFSIADTSENQGQYNTRVFRLYYTMVLSLLLALIPMTKIFIILVMSEAYKTACDYAAFYYLGAAFQSFSSMFGIGYLRNSNTGGAFKTSIYGSVVNVVVNLSFIGFIGLHAAPFSTFIGFAVMWLIRERNNREELQIKINWKEFVILTSLVVLMCVISMKTGFETNIILTLIGTVAFVIVNIKNLGQLLKKLKKKVSG